MNIIAKIWAWLALAIGIMAFLTSMTGEVFDGTAMLGGVMFTVTAIIALTYIWRDDEVKKQAKQQLDDERIAKIVAERINQ